MKVDYILRSKAGAYLELNGEVLKISEIAVKGKSFQVNDVKVTKTDKLAYTKADKLAYRTNLMIHWAADEEEPWVLATN